MDLQNKDNNNIANMIYSKIEERDKKKKKRYYLGLSSIGNNCPYSVYIEFRKYVEEKKNGRVLRLLRRGHLEEPQIIRDLRGIGLKIKHTGEKNQRAFNPHPMIQGHCDGVIISGVPNDENTKYILEIKTMNKKHFNDLIKGNLKSIRREYYDQIQAYMLCTRAEYNGKGDNIEKCLFVAVCKDDDNIYTEVVNFNEDLAKNAMHQYKIIAESEYPLGKKTNNPNYWECKNFCPYYNFCWGTDKKPYKKCCRNCENCITYKGMFFCKEDDKELSLRSSLRKCDKYKIREIK